MDLTMIVKPKDLSLIFAAASTYFTKLEKKCGIKEFENAKKVADDLRRKIDYVKWDKGAKLFIDEMPF